MVPVSQEMILMLTISVSFPGNLPSIPLPHFHRHVTRRGQLLLIILLEFPGAALKHDQLFIKYGYGT